jgi:hypothetical protein
MKFRLILATTLACLCILSIASSFFKAPAEDHTRNLGYQWEEYNPSLFFKFQHIDDVIDVANERFSAGERNKIDYFNFIAQLIRERFYHGYSYYTLSDNPLAFLAGKVHPHLSAIVIPEDIMKHPMAACSQQAVVLMEIFRRCKVDYRKVGFANHYAVEAMINGEWCYFDTDIEPKIQDGTESLENLISSGRFDAAYKETKLNINTINQLETTYSYGKINAIPAPRAELFHRLCYLLVSKSFLVTGLLLAILSFTPLDIFYLRRLKRIYAYGKLSARNNSQ